LLGALILIPALSHFLLNRAPASKSRRRSRTKPAPAGGLIRAMSET
jgi:hypothetical protein